SGASAFTGACHCKCRCSAVVACSAGHVRRRLRRAARRLRCRRRHRCGRAAGRFRRRLLLARHAGDPLAGAVAVIRALAGGVEGFPRNAGRIVDPGFFRLGVAAGRLPLVDHLASGLVQPGVDLVELVAAFHLDAEMIEPRLAPAGRDGEIHARIVEHPLGVVALDHGRRAGEQRRIEADRPMQVLDGDVHVHALHGVTSAVPGDSYSFFLRRGIVKSGGRRRFAWGRNAMVFLYVVRGRFTEPAREQAWNAWYSGPKIEQMLAQPHFLTCQRFRRAAGTGRDYLTLWTVDSPQALATPRYTAQWGFAEWTPYIADWSRDLFDGGAA